MRTRILALLLVCLLLVPTANAQTDDLHVVASFYPMYCMLLNLTRDVPGVSVECLAPSDIGCVHDYQLTTADRRRLDQADLLVINGVGMEAFLTPMLPQLSATVVDASAGLSLLALEGTILRGDDARYNEHVWVSIPLAIQQLETIADALAQADPGHAELYEANRAAYTQTLEALYQRMQAELAPYKGTPIVTFHSAFDYFAKDFELEIVAVLRRESGSAPSARDIAAVVDIVRAKDVHALFIEPQYPRDAADVVARETGITPYTLDPVATHTEGVPDIDAYVTAMERNLATLLEALP